MKRTAEEELEDVLKKTPMPINDGLIPTSTGGMRIKYDGYEFEHHYTRKTVARYRCVFHTTTKCNASIVTKDRNVYPYITEHDH